MPTTFGWNPIDLGSVPALPGGEVHIFAITLDPDEGWNAKVRQVLDHTEHERAARFRFDVDRYRFQKTRAALRLLLSNYLSSSAEDIAFREGSHGKPYLGDAGSDLQFNVSHTRGAAVLAFARGFEIGIDIEQGGRQIDVEGVGRRVFTDAERANYLGQTAPARLRQFFRLWTAKEAYLKATGSGLSCDPASIEANFESGSYYPVSAPDQRLPYALREVETTNEFLVCLAHREKGRTEIRASELI